MAFNDIKSKHFSKALRDSGVYFYQLHTSFSRSRIGRQQNPRLIWAKVL